MSVSRVLAGVDGSECSDAALSWSAELCRDLGAELIVVHACGLLEIAADKRRGFMGHTRGETEAMVRGTWTDAARSAGTTPTIVIEDGPPILVLPRVAESRHVDLVVVGIVGASAVPQMAYGSVANRLPQICPVPVVIVPSPM